MESRVSVTAKTMQCPSHYQHLWTASKFALRHKTTRLNFAKKHEKKPDEYWKRILWSDETKIKKNSTPIGSSMFGVNLARTTTVNA